LIFLPLEQQVNALTPSKTTVSCSKGPEIKAELSSCRKADFVFKSGIPGYYSRLF
jgi:hypothetical protein